MTSRRDTENGKPHPTAAGSAHTSEYVNGTAAAHLQAKKRLRIALRPRNTRILRKLKARQM